MLRSCYETSLAVAEEIGARTLAYPLVSAGVYGWPKDDAIRQALTVLTADEGDREATMVLFDAAVWSWRGRSSASSAESGRSAAHDADPGVRRIAVGRLVGDVDGAVLLGVDALRDGERALALASEPSEIIFPSLPNSQTS